MELNEHTLRFIQLRAQAWHEERFPHANASNVALKLCEEAGEVASAINGTFGALSATGKGDVGDEVADVFIAGLVLLGRWFPDCNITTRIIMKLNKLEEVGAHPASLLGGE